MLTPLPAASIMMFADAETEAHRRKATVLALEPSKPFSEHSSCGVNIKRLPWVHVVTFGFC